MYTVCGPLCTPMDTLAKNAEFNTVAPNDLLSISNVGAYGYSASLVGFLSHPHAIEISVHSKDNVGLVEAGQTRDSRRNVYE